MCVHSDRKHGLPYCLASSTDLHRDLLLSSTAQTPPRRTETGTRLWTWWRTGTPTSRTCWEETPRCWTPLKKAAWLGCRSYAAPTTSTVGIRRGATRHRCTSQVTCIAEAAHTFTGPFDKSAWLRKSRSADWWEWRVKSDVLRWCFAEVCKIELILFIVCLLVPINRSLTPQNHLRLCLRTGAKNNAIHTNSWGRKHIVCWQGGRQFSNLLLYSRASERRQRWRRCVSSVIVESWAAAFRISLTTN